MFVFKIPILKGLNIFSKCQINSELKWQQTTDQPDKMILPAYKEMAKQSFAYFHQFGCHTEYFADILRDIADSLTSIHPKYQSEYGFSCC